MADLLAIVYGLDLAEKMQDPRSRPSRTLLHDFAFCKRKHFGTRKRLSQEVGKWRVGIESLATLHKLRFTNLTWQTREPPTSEHRVLSGKDKCYRVHSNWLPVEKRLFLASVTFKDHRFIRGIIFRLLQSIFGKEILNKWSIPCTAGP